MAARPWNLERVQQARDTIASVVDDGLALEACVTATNYEMMTMLVDANLRKEVPSYITTVLKCVLYVGRTIMWFLPKSWTG